MANRMFHAPQSQIRLFCPPPRCGLRGAAPCFWIDVSSSELPFPRASLPYQAHSAVRVLSSGLVVAFKLCAMHSQRHVSWDRNRVACHRVTLKPQSWSVFVSLELILGTVTLRPGETSAPNSEISIYECSCQMLRFQPDRWQVNASCKSRLWTNAEGLGR